jgi:4-diphosphocytidyl-2-C-methyl-D-erythritol kinase
VTSPLTRSIEAPAKINLFLRVLHRREDGFRELETLFQMLDVADDVRVRFDPAGPSGVVTLDVDGPDLGAVEDNLAVRAVRAFMAASGVRGSVHVSLLKRIPAGGGLGGGSSDAAAVLRLLAELIAELPKGSSLPEAGLHTIATNLGSDVPFFLGVTPLALGRGRGEVLSPLPALPAVPVVLALPPVHVSTAEAYSALAASPAAEAVVQPRSDDIVADLDWARIATLAENDFEGIATAGYPAIARSIEGLRGAGARVALLSGSGAAAFGVFESSAAAAVAATTLESELGWPFVVTATRDAPPQSMKG